MTVDGEQGQDDRTHEESDGADEPEDERRPRERRRKEARDTDGEQNGEQDSHPEGGAEQDQEFRVQRRVAREHLSLAAVFIGALNILLYIMRHSLLAFQLALCVIRRFVGGAALGEEPVFDREVGGVGIVREEALVGVALPVVADLFFEICRLPLHGVEFLERGEDQVVAVPDLELLRAGKLLFCVVALDDGAFVFAAEAEQFALPAHGGGKAGSESGGARLHVAQYRTLVETPQRGKQGIPRGAQPFNGGAGIDFLVAGEHQVLDRLAYLVAGFAVRELPEEGSRFIERPTHAEQSLARGHTEVHGAGGAEIRYLAGLGVAHGVPLAVPCDPAVDAVTPGGGREGHRPLCHAGLPVDALFPLGKQSLALVEAVEHKADKGGEGGFPRLVSALDDIQPVFKIHGVVAEQSETANADLF